MNICLLNNVFPPILTGSSLFTYDLAAQLSKAGHNVIVITSKANDNNLNYEMHEKGFKLYRLNKIRMFKSNLWMNFPDFYLTAFPSNFTLVRSILIENKIEVLHQCNNIFDLVFMSAYLSKKMKLPLICSLTTQIQHSNVRLNKVLELFDRTVVRHLFAKHVTCFLAGDKETERYINERYKRYTGIKTIHYGVSGLEQFAELKRDYSKTYGVLVSLGHVSFVKDRKELIEAWPHVLKSLPKAKILIIGSLFSKTIELLINKNHVEKSIEFTGGVQRETIPSLISNSDIGCMFFSNVPYSRGVGSANIELMASGLPVILDAEEDNFGEEMPFKNGIHFVQLENRDPQWLADKILELMNNPQLRKNIGLAGKEFVTKQLTWERVLPLMESLYMNQIQSSKVCNN